MRFLTAGESHGPQLTAIIEGLPAGLPLRAEQIDIWLARRQGGYGRGRRMQIETDRVQLLAGVRQGRTTGAPLALAILNRDHQNWLEVMDPSPSEGPRKRRVSRPRPGHADLAGGIKYRLSDLRDVLERASARETAARVAVGAVAHALLGELGIGGASLVRELGGVTSHASLDWDDPGAIWNSPVSCPDPEASAAMVAEIDAAKERGDTLGGVVEVRYRGLPIGLGSHVHWDRKLDGLLAQAVMRVQAIKGVEIGLGFQAARLPGQQVHDPILYGEQGFARSSNSAGGIEGGMTNGEELLLRAAMKPIATLMRPLPAVDIVTHQPADAAIERSDTTAVPACAVIVQMVVAWTLANALLEKLGGDSMEQIRERFAADLTYARRYL